MRTIFNTLEENIAQITESFIMENLYKNQDVLDALVDLQREQMLDNKDSEGTSFGGYKKATEARNTKRVTKVTAGDPIILKDTGEFHSKLKAVVDKDKAKLTSTSDKTDKITAMYGDEVFGLSEQYLKSFREFIRYTNYVSTILYNKLRYGN